MKQVEAELVTGDEQPRDRKGRRRLTRGRRAEVVKEYERSGLTQAEFARRSGLVYTTFAHWVQRSRREAKASMRSARAYAPALRLGFVEVRAVALPEPALPASELSVTLPDGVVLRGCDPAGLAALLRALRVNGS